MKVEDPNEKCSDTIRPVSGWWVLEKEEQIKNE
jgi:hypothetical protein